MEKKPSRILIVDDEKNIRLTLRHALETEGYAISAAVNGEDALKQCQEAEFDLVLLDLRMPGMDGIELLRRLADGYPDTRVIILTAHGTIENAVEALKLGAVDFIQKPFAPQEIRALVATVLDRQHLAEDRAADYATRLELAKRALNARHFATAAEQIRRAIADDPARPEAFNLLGVLQELEGDHHQAVTNFRIALDLDPTYAPARQNLDRASGFAGSPRRYDLE